MKILIIVPVIILTSIIALLYIRSGQTFFNTSVSTKKVYRIVNNELMNEYTDKPNDTIVQDYEVNILKPVLESTVTDQIQDENLVIRPSTYSTNSKPTNKYYNKNYISNNNYNETKNTLYEPRMHQTNKRLLNHDDYSNIEEEKLSERDTSIGYQNAYDLTTNVNGYKVNQNPIYGTGWTTIDQPEQWYPSGSLPSRVSEYSSSWDRPSYVLENYKPSVDPSTILTNHHKLKDNKINLKKIAILALIKLGLVKIQAIGFLNIVFLLGLKLKIFMIAVFFKFFLFLKSIKFYKILTLPLFILQLLPAFMKLLSMAQQIISMIKRSSPESNFPTNQSINLVSSTLRPSTIIENRIPSIMTGTVIPGGNILNNIPDIPIGNTIPTFTTSTRTRMSNPMIDTYILNSNINKSIPAETGLSAFKLDGLNTLNGGHNESLELFDQSLDILEKILDSKKCIERIACRIAAAEKFGIIPVWINWMLRRVSKFIPNETLELYFKTYKIVNNEIHTKLLNTDNLATWCVERYICNSDEKTNVTDTN